MTSEDAYALAERITADRLWHVHEIVVRPGYPRDCSLRVKRSFYAPEIEDGSARVEAEITRPDDYALLRLMATAASTEAGLTLRGMPS